MPNINGTNHDDYLLGTTGDDVINGRRGNDWIEGGKGNDVLTGDSDPLHDDGMDTFTFRAGDGHDTVTDFQHGEDRLMFDSGTGVYDGILPPLGSLYDGETFSNSQNTASWTVAAGDYNGDGFTDTRIEMFVGGNSVGMIDLLSVAPSTLTSADIFGG